MRAEDAIAVEGIVENYIAAIGGREALSTLTSRRFEGSIQAQGMAGSILNVSKSPDKNYQLVDLGAFKQEVGFDGEIAWKKDKNGLVVQTGPEWEQARHNAIFNKILHYRDETLYTELTLIGRQQIGEKTAYSVEFRFGPDRRTVTYYDTDTFLELKSVNDVSVQGNRVKREVILGDYRSVERLLLPFSIRQITAVNKAEIKVDRYLLNQPIDDRIFSPASR